MAIILLPQTDALADAMNVAKNSAEGAQYLETRFEEILKAAKVWEQSQEMMAVIRKFTATTTSLFASLSAEAWSGQPVDPSRLKNMQAHIAAEALQQLESFGNEGKKARMDVAINDESKLVRGYADSEGHALDTNSTDAFDASFNAWLVENNMVTKSGILYELDQSGQIKRDAHGNEVKVDATKMRELMDDPQKGFAAYLNRKGIELDVQQQEYAASTAAPAA